tara:strand:- start:1454 stop:2380 length:927 start_codon:yes stop_codon:yes gene_type:complete
MKISIFGATGFVGNYILKSLVKKEYRIKTLVRKKSINKLFNSEKLEIIHGDINDINVIENTIKDTDIIIYNIGIIREFRNKNITFENLHLKGFKRVLESAKKQSIKRIILMSANGVSSKGTKYQTTKWNAEQELINSGIDWTIFRPSLIFGKPMHSSQPEFCTQLKKDMIMLPIPAPLFHKGILPLNAGMFQLSPIHVENIASFFVNSIENNDSINKIFHLGGLKSFTWKEIIQIISKSCQKNKFMIPAPVIFIKLISSLFERFESFPITKDQITMLLEGNIVNENHFNEFNITPIEFNKDTLKYLKK